MHRLLPLCLPYLAWAPSVAAQISWCPVDTGGFGDAANIGSVVTAEFGGALYIGTFNPSGARLFRYDGAGATPVTIPGLSANNEAIVCGVVHQGDLVLGTMNSTDGGEVWRFDGTSWSQIGAGGLGGGAAAPSIDRLADHNGLLVAGLGDSVTGSRVHANLGGTTWSQINSSGFGCGADNEEVYGLASFGGALWATTNNDDGCQVWRWSPLGPWNRRDPIATLGCAPPGGFASSGNTGAHALEVVGNPPVLLVGTEDSNGAEVWRWDGAWTRLFTGGFGDPNNFIVHDFLEQGGLVYAVTENASTGCEVWRFQASGGAAERVDPGAPAGAGGFGVGSDNEIAYELVEFQGRVLVSTLNFASGGEVWELGIGAPYCAANANSTGNIASVCARGSLLAADDDVALTAFRLPTNTVGYFLNSRTQGFVANAGGSSGNLCLSGAVGRYNTQVLSSGAGGTYTLSLNLAATPQPTGIVSVLAGETWNFQSWYRDSAGGTPVSNFTEAVAIAFQ